MHPHNFKITSIDIPGLAIIANPSAIETRDIINIIPQFSTPLIFRATCAFIIPSTIIQIPMHIGKINVKEAVLQINTNPIIISIVACASS